jgi:hypothetical protein
LSIQLKKYFAVIAWEQFLGFRAEEYLKHFQRIKASRILENEIVFDDNTRADFESTLNFLQFAANMLILKDPSQSIFAFLNEWIEAPNLVSVMLDDIRNKTMHDLVDASTHRFTPAQWIEELLELENDMIANANIDDIYHD